MDKLICLLIFRILSITIRLALTRNLPGPGPLPRRRPRLSVFSQPKISCQHRIACSRRTRNSRCNYKAFNGGAQRPRVQPGPGPPGPGLDPAKTKPTPSRTCWAISSDLSCVVVCLNCQRPDSSFFFHCCRCGGTGTGMGRPLPGGGSLNPILGPDDDPNQKGSPVLSDWLKSEGDSF